MRTQLELFPDLPAPKPAPVPEPELEPDPSDGLFDALWYGEHDGEVFDGDPADIW